MQQPAIWRELLRSSIENSQERQRIASELGVNPMTLMRWVNGESVPRSKNLRRLFSALPQHRNHLIKLIGQKFKGFAAVMRDEHSRFPGFTVVLGKRALLFPAYQWGSLQAACWF